MKFHNIQSRKDSEAYIYIFPGLRIANIKFLYKREFPRKADSLKQNFGRRKIPSVGGRGWERKSNSILLHKGKQIQGRVFSGKEMRGDVGKNRIFKLHF